MKKIGIMGGTFNPVHFAHLVLAEQALQYFSLNQILFLPSGRPPHKESQEILDSRHRYRMLQEAIKGNPNFSLSDYEINKTGICYTADTVRELSELYPDTKTYFIIGGDSILEFDHWKRPEEIVRYTNVVACGRSGNDNSRVQEKIELLNRQFGSQIQYFEVPSMEISSKMLRSYVRDGKSIRYFVPDPVYEYIHEYGLYRN